jgi:alkanesulfonate monooxygenase SsuD/methylene tetrahydromethanopterin reductase-like flavin-dependent oxidoreductase (luciferase family)
VRVGLVIPSREAYLSGASARDLTEMAVAAERLGFDSVWVGDSLTARPRAEPLTLLSAIASRTERVGLGTAAFTASLRPTALAAHAIATLDDLSAGRLTLALGSGFPIPDTMQEFAAAGADYARRIGQLERNVATWRWMWSRDESPPPPHLEPDEAELLRRIPVPVQSGGPALWLAGSGPRALHRAGGLCDGWLPYPPSADEYRAQYADVVEARRGLSVGADRAFEAALYVTVVIDDNQDRAPSRLDAYSHAYYGFDAATLGLLQAVVVGAHDQCAQELLRYVEAGARHVLIRLGHLDATSMLEPAAEVAEALRAQRHDGGCR